MGALENAVQEACLQYLKMRGHFCWRMNNAPVYDPIRGCYRKRGKWEINGLPDIIGLTKDGLFFGVECKSAKGKLSEDQEAFAGRVLANNGIWICAKSVDDLIRGGL